MRTCAFGGSVCVSIFSRRKVGVIPRNLDDNLKNNVPKTFQFKNNLRSPLGKNESINSTFSSSATPPAMLPPWRRRGGRASGALGRGRAACPAPGSCSCGSDLMPDPGAPWASGWPKEKKFKSHPPQKTLLSWSCLIKGLTVTPWSACASGRPPQTGLHTDRCVPAF